MTLDDIKAARSALPAGEWISGMIPAGPRGVEMRTIAGRSWLEVFHDRSPAPSADVAFVASAPADVDRLLAGLADRGTLTDGVLDQISARCLAATAGPWVAHLESGGGLGGANVITMVGSVADLYLTVDGLVAPDEFWTFVAMVCSEIPKMVERLRSGQ